jgi:Zn finger protein HypA/HybF involved in hydrogenase expression
MNHLRRVQNLKRVSIQLPRDEDGFLGRECPECEAYFKVEPGTGVSGDNPCHCPYCGHSAVQNHFFTKDQVAYSRSIALRKVRQAFQHDLDDFARSLNSGSSGSSRGSGLRISMHTTVKHSPLPSIRHYREKELETKVVCERCSLHYAIYGAFAFCPDCGSHNSAQILSANLEIAEKILAMADSAEADVRSHVIGDALENAVAAFDGFGRESCRVWSAKAADIAKAEKLSFQNLAGAQQRVQDLFGFDIASCLKTEQWDFACRCFQKRHLLAHNMGVVDEEYLRKTNDPQAIKGRKVSIETDEVKRLVGVLVDLGAFLFQELEAK